MPKRGEQQKRKSRERERANTPSGKAPPNARTDRDTEGELRRYEPISDELLLAAIDRAERHREAQRDGVLWPDIVAHLGFVRTGWTTLQLRPQRDALIAGGLLAAGRRQGFDVWSLTDAGRAHLETARQSGPIGELPESPQHRAWRYVRANAAEVVEPLRANARTGGEEALGLLDARQRVHSDAWLLLAARLGKGCRQLGLATHCLYEWAEPTTPARTSTTTRTPVTRSSTRMRAAGCSHCDLAMLDAVPDLRPALATATEEKLAAIFQAFDVEITYDRDRQTLKLAATITPELIPDFDPNENYRPEGRSQINDIAGAGSVRISPTFAVAHTGGRTRSPKCGSSHEYCHSWPIWTA